VERDHDLTRPRVMQCDAAVSFSMGSDGSENEEDWQSGSELPRAAWT